MALDATFWTIRSDKTPEIAFRTDASDIGWALSWLPGRLLTFDEAVSGMVLDEILSDPAPQDPDYALELAAIRAADLGLTIAQAVALLWLRSAQPDEPGIPATVHP